MKKYLIYLILSLVSLSAVSCSDKNKSLDNIGILGVVTKSYFVSFEGGILAIPVTHSVDVTVSIEGNPSWISQTATKATVEDKFNFTVSPNPEKDERSCVIRFSNERYRLLSEVKVTQEAFVDIPDPRPDPDPESHDFDETQVVYSFANLSDTHIDGTSTPTAIKLKNALTQLQEQARINDKDGLDAVLIAGDLVNTPYNNRANYKEFDYFKQVYESVLNISQVPMIYTPGNHDVYGQWTASSAAEAQYISERLGSAYFAKDLDMDAKKTLECRHCRIGDFNVLCILPNGRGPVGYSNESLAWLDYKLSEITKASPDRYVYVLTHPMIYNTVYGSLLGPDWLNGHCSDYWYTKSLTDILSRYPQVVTFSGHLHFPINDPRSIWQGSFTSLGCGSVRYMAIEDGEYENMSSTTVMSDCNDVSTGLLTQVDAMGNIKITKMFFSQNTTFGKPWYISHPSADLSHLSKYDHRKLSAANTAPVLTSMNVNLQEASSSSKNATVRFSAGRDDEFVHHYVVILKKSGAQVKKMNILADFYRNADPSEMKSDWTVSLGTLQSGSYQVTVTAFDSWDASSNVLSKSFEI